MLFAKSVRENQTKVGLKKRKTIVAALILGARKSDQSGIENRATKKAVCECYRENQTKVGLKISIIVNSKTNSPRENQTKVGLKTPSSKIIVATDHGENQTKVGLKTKCTIHISGSISRKSDQSGIENVPP